MRTLRPMVAAISRLGKRTALVVMLLAVVSRAHGWEDTPRLRIYYLAYPVDWNGKTIMIGARLQLPFATNGKIPAVVILHGTAGLSYSGVYYAAELNRAGIASLEIDQWGGRGLPGGASSRPNGLGDNLRDVAGAYHLLAERPEIDAGRIGLMGSSMGGIQSMLMMTRRNSDAILGQDVHFKAAVALYPICWLYNHVPGADFVDLVDAPVRIMVGSKDDYDGDAGACEALLHELAPRDAAHMSLRVFSGATHIFDTFTGTFEYNDPTAHRRQGGVIHVRPDPERAQTAGGDLPQ